MATGLDLIIRERLRQITVEGYSIEHDAKHTCDELAYAAICYATPPQYRKYWTTSDCPQDWPWRSEEWKPCPDDRIAELVKAGAFIAAEIDRLQADRP